jgi:hypothetical protein
MSIHVTERNGSDCKYIKIFTHCVGSIGALSRETAFTRGAKSKQWEVRKIAGRNTKANIFQKGSAGFKAMIDLTKKKKVPQCDVFFYVKNADLISLKAIV